jgi:Carbohydrate esterase, sialic acid-specific acetylesterase
METRNDVSKGSWGRLCAYATWLATATVFGCGVSGGSTGSPSGTAGVSGAAGEPASGGSSGNGPGAAGTTGAGGNTTGVAGTTGAAGGTSGGGTTGSAGVTGAAGVTGTGGAIGAAGVSGGTGGTPLSGITVNIGGTNVPKENAIAFLHFGHSNMAGRGVDLPATRPYFFGPTDPHAWMYHSGVGFQPAVEPTAGDSGNMVNGMVSGGPGTALVKEAAALAPDKYFISIGYGQGSAYCSQFLPGALYYSKVMAGALELKGKVTFAGIMIYLGITERHGTQADINNYPQCINQLVTQIRTDLGEPNLPLMINDYEMGTTGPLAVGSAFELAIEPKILMVPMVVSNSVLIPTDGVAIQDDHSTTDDHHFSLDGQKEYVRRMLATMQMKGWFPWQ